MSVEDNKSIFAALPHDHYIANEVIRQIRLNKDTNELILPAILFMADCIEDTVWGVSGLDCVKRPHTGQDRVKVYDWFRYGV